MERVQVLIDKLIEQKQRNETPSQLLLTVHLLQNELMKLQQKNSSWGTSKVSVVLPMNTAMAAHESREEEVAVESYKPEPAKENIPQAPTFVPERKREEPPKPPPFIPERKQEEPKQEAPKQQDVHEHHEHLVEERIIEKESRPLENTHEPFDVFAETPTLMQHHQQKELHELIGEVQESLNDKLKEEKTELAHVLKDGPVKDLRKAIGINDKFVFINDLFRGDEAMYERSIKTINGFHILAEAEYWINRELKVKLGWNDNKDTVQHFYQMVRRRFA